jgi:hypothetical protein
MTARPALVHRAGSLTTSDPLRETLRALNRPRARRGGGRGPDRAAPAGRGAACSRGRRGSRRRPLPRLRGGARERRNVSRYRGGRARLAWLSGRGGRRPTLNASCAAAAREGGRADRSLVCCPSAPRPSPLAPSSLKLLFHGCWYWVLVLWFLPWPQEWVPSPPQLLVHLERLRASVPRSQRRPWRHSDVPEQTAPVDDATPFRVFRLRLPSAPPSRGTGFLPYTQRWSGCRNILCRRFCSDFSNALAFTVSDSPESGKRRRNSTTWFVETSLPSRLSVTSRTMPQVKTEPARLAAPSPAASIC